MSFCLITFECCKVDEDRVLLSLWLIILGLSKWLVILLFLCVSFVINFTRLAGVILSVSMSLILVVEAISLML